MKRIVVLICLLLPSIVWGDSAGPNSPGSAADEGDWNQPSEVLASDDVRANFNSTSQDKLRAYNFNFSISGTIGGIEVGIEGYSPQPNPSRRTINVGLSKGGYVLEGNWKSDTLCYTSGGEAYVQYGSSGDIWNGSWSAGDVNDSGFGVLIRDADEDANSLYVDHVRVTVYYTQTGGGGDISYTRRRFLAVEDEE